MNELSVYELAEIRLMVSAAGYDNVHVDAGDGVITMTWPDGNDAIIAMHVFLGGNAPGYYIYSDWDWTAVPRQFLTAKAAMQAILNGWKDPARAHERDLAATT